MEYLHHYSDVMMSAMASQIMCNECFLTVYMFIFEEFIMSKSVYIPNPIDCFSFL